MDTESKTRITISFDIVPVACGRPRLGRFKIHTPKKTSDYKKTLTEILHLNILQGKLKEEIAILYDSPICLTATFSMPIPQRLIRKKDPQPWRTALPVAKPDTDNLIKGAKDVLSGVVYKDDSQVTHEFVRKIYGDRPYVKITIEPATVGTYNYIFE